MSINMKIVCDDLRYLPKYANESDTCMDLKVRIDMDKLNERNKYSEGAIIYPNETLVFGTGIKVSIPEDHVMLIFPRSSTGINLRCMLTNTTGVIDPGYRDEIRLALTNFGDDIVRITDAQRLAQFMIIPRPVINLELVKDDEDFRSNDRGGGIGSTGTK